jgi:hypothetical protein
MANAIIPLDNSPNQNFQVTVNVDGNLITLAIELRYNSMAGYWVMTISDTLGNIVLDSIPLITGVWPAANLLRQYQYLGIGSAYILNASGPIPGLDYPNNTDLGSDFVLLWGDSA